MRSKLNFIFHMDAQLFHYLILKRLSFHWITWVLLSKSIDCVSLFLNSIQLHCVLISLAIEAYWFLCLFFGEECERGERYDFKVAVKTRSTISCLKAIVKAIVFEVWEKNSLEVLQRKECPQGLAKFQLKP